MGYWPSPGRAGCFTGNRIPFIEGIGVDTDYAGNTNDHHKIVQDHALPEGYGDFIYIH